jgi:adenylate kinase family enzyme
MKTLTKPQVFIFIGRSGCGKGAQVDLLIKALKEADSSRGVLYIQTGQEFRKFIQGQSFSAKRSKVCNEKGGLQPEFLAIKMWVDALVDNYNGTDHVVFDGTPRKFHEAGVLESIFDFYDFDKPYVVNIDVSREESRKRLLLRKRMDDNESEISKRLDWYETDVAPTVEYFRKNAKYIFLKIDGERPIPDIHADLMKRLGFR